MKILIIGGTEEARLLADALAGMGHEVVTSLAGRTGEPLLPKGKVRSGGFGGREGLAGLIREQKFNRLVDASHPYAVQIAENAVAAAEETGIRFVRLVRPAWTEPQYAFWIHVPDAETAAAKLPGGARALLTVGHRDLDVYLARKDCTFLVRSIEPPEKPLPPHAESLIARPPFYIGGETKLLQDEAITHLISKNSGGAQTEAKLRAAQQLSVKVIMLARPALPPAKEVQTVGRALAALRLDLP